MTWNLTPLTRIYKYAALHDITMCLKENNWTYICIYCFLLNHTSHYDPTKAWDQRNQEQVVFSIQSRNEMNCFRHYLTMRIVNPFSVITYNRYKRLSVLPSCTTQLSTSENELRWTDVRWTCLAHPSTAAYSSTTVLHSILLWETTWKYRWHDSGLI